MKALYSFETSEIGNDISSHLCRSESAATWLLSYFACGYRCYRGYFICQILKVARVVLFINVTGLHLVCLIIFAIIISLVNKVTIHFLVILFPHCPYNTVDYSISPELFRLWPDLSIGILQINVYYIWRFSSSFTVNRGRFR